MDKQKSITIPVALLSQSIREIVGYAAHHHSTKLTFRKQTNVCSAAARESG
jgi:hypothetical protein